MLLIAGLHVPLIPLVEVVGNVNDPPAQIAGTCVNAGTVELLFTVTVMVVAEAHCPAFGVNVYVVVVVLLIAGLQVPLIPLPEVAGSVNDPPVQIAGTCVNAGTVELFTVTVMVVVEAHCPAFGVKVYVVVAALLIAGLHVPLIPLPEVDGSVNDPPEQMAGTCVNAGVTLFTVTVMVVVKAHCPVFGVKVYVVVAILLMAGFHVPLIPLLELAGSVKDSPAQIAGTCVNTGVTEAVTVIVTALLVAVADEAQDALLVITQVTMFPFASVVVV